MPESVIGREGRELGPLAARYSGVFVVLHLVGAYLAPSYLWPLSSLRYVPLAAGFSLVVLYFALSTRAASTSLSLMAARCWTRVTMGSGNVRSWGPLLVGVPAFVLFFTLRCHNHFLGDGYLRLAELRTGEMSLRRAEFLDLLLHREVWGLLKSHGVRDPALAYALPSAVAGALWVSMMPALSRLLVTNPGHRWVVPAALLTMGSVQLFFGYVECYTMRELLALAYFLFALRALRGTSSLPAILTLGLASAFHLTALVLAPSAVWLVVTRGGRQCNSNRHDPTRRFGGLGLAGAALLVTAGLGFGSLYLLRTTYQGLGVILPLHDTPRHAYSILAPAHLADVARFVLLSSPGAILLLAVVSARDGARSTWRRLRALVRRVVADRDPEIGFWALSTAGSIAYLFAVDPRLGALDWDLMSATAAPLTLAAVVLAFSKPGESSSAGNDLGRVGVLVFGACLLHVIPWIANNQSAYRSAVMTRDMVARDAHHFSGQEPLFVRTAFLMQEQGQSEHALYLLRRGVATVPGA